jgi:DNA-binding NarL/FixJ family response regulator
MLIRVLVADDHQLIRDTLTDLFNATDDLTVVSQCADGSEVAPAVALTAPDVVLMDLHMPRVDGLTAAREVLAVHPLARIIVLSGGLMHATAREAAAIGVVGYLLKDDDPGELPDRVRTVARGGTAWHPLAAALLASNGGAAVPASHLVECPVRFR